MYTYDENLFSDLHKDAYGFRPKLSHYFWDADEATKQRIWDDLLVHFNREVDRENYSKKKATKDFQRQINLCLSHGAKDRTEAVAWIIDSLNFNAIDLMYGGEKLCFELGLPFSMKNDPDFVAYFESDKVKQAIKDYFSELEKERE